MILEPSALGKVKTMRKGTGFYHLAVTGRAAHAGLEPEKGANALIALAELIGRLGAIARPELGTSVTPTVAAAGTAANVVPAGAHADIDVRVADPAEASRVDAELRALTTAVPGTRLTVSGGPNRPPMPWQATEALFGVARAAAADLGIPPLAGTAVGGGSDGNFTAAAGLPHSRRTRCCGRRRPRRGRVRAARGDARAGGAAGRPHRTTADRQLSQRRRISAALIETALTEAVPN